MMTDPNLLDLLRRDLAAMSVPGTELTVRQGSDGWTSVEWERRDQLFLEAEFRLVGPSDFNRVRVLIDGEELSYASFMSSPDMANLRALARTVETSAKQLDSFVSPRATGLGELRPATDLLRSAATPIDDVTNLVFVTGAAGDGKTSLLEHVVSQEARRYRDAQTSTLWLYVSAQGRRLAKLDDAVGNDLGRLQANFSFEAVPTLVRCGVLKLVIDGFDELLGLSGSYDESFSSLASFLGELYGTGVVVAAARSAYYEQEFAARIDRAIGFSSDGWTVSRVDLLPWGAAEQNEFLEASIPDATDREGVARKLERARSRPEVGAILQKPFFLARTVDLLRSDPEFLSEDDQTPDLLTSLVFGYLRREVREKLVERAGRPLVSVEGLRDILSEIAGEMWLQNTTELNRASLREVVEVMAAEVSADAETQDLLIERAPTVAVLRTGSTAGSIAFEHDVYHAFFLSEPLLRTISQNSTVSVRQALRRNVSPEAAEMVARRYNGSIRELIATLGEAAEKQDLFSDTVSRNAGTLVGQLVRAQRAVSDVTLSHLDLSDLDLSDTEVTGVTLSNCRLTGVDLSGAKWTGTSSASVYDRVAVSEETQLDLTGARLQDFIALIDYAGNGRPLFSPDEMRTVLDRCGLPSAAHGPELREVDPQAVAVIEGLSRLYSRTNLIAITDDGARDLVHNSRFEAVRRVLEEQGALTSEVRSASGQKLFLRAHIAFGELMQGLNARAPIDARSLAIWTSLEQTLPA